MYSIIEASPYYYDDGWQLDSLRKTAIGHCVTVYYLCHVSREGDPNRIKITQ